MTDEITAAGNPAAEPAAAPADTLAPAIDAWWSEHVHGSPIAQHTAIYNHLRSIIPALTERLRPLIKD